MTRVAYFSAEYAFDDLPIYAGGLGVLAVDYLSEIGQTDQELIAIGLFYRHGFAGLEGTPPTYDPKQTGWELVQADNQPLKLKLRLGSTDIRYQAWTKRFGSAKVYLLDSGVEPNDETAKNLCAWLYDQDFTTKILQDALLGIGGVQLLEALGITDVLYHLNEGHTAFAAFARLAFHKQQKPHATLNELCEAVRQETVASKHTVLSGAGLYIHISEFPQIFGQYLQDHGLEPAEVFNLARDPVRQDDFTTTRLMLTLSRSTNAVSTLHATSEKTMHPGSPFSMLTITNGIHLPRWQHPEIAASIKQPQLLWSQHELLRSKLVTLINDRCGSELESDRLTLVWARRITSYKRPLELFSDLMRLQAIITNQQRPIQVIIAGKPNPQDEVGVEMARQLGEHTLNPIFNGQIAYLQAYDLSVAKYLVQGADLWLNTPQKGYEASGTSGMKAGSNGALQCSVSDGWIDEADLKDVGWIVPDLNAADTLYGYLEHQIAPGFYERNTTGIPEQWVAKMQATIELIETNFTTWRMLDDYLKRLYRFE